MRQGITHTEFQPHSEAQPVTILLFTLPLSPANNPADGGLSQASSTVRQG